MNNQAQDGCQASPDVRPFWVPAGLDWNALPAEVKAAIGAVVAPAYRDLVLEARDGLERATGVTLVHMLWLEVLDQLELGRLLLKSHSTDVPAEERQQAIAQHLKLVQAKLKASSFMLRLQEFERRWGRPMGRVGRLQKPMGPLSEPAELTEPWGGKETEEEILENAGTC